MPNSRVTVGQGTSDTFMRLLRIGRPRDTGPDSETLTLDELMSESEAHLERLARGKQGPNVLVASRILDTPQEFRRWEGGHARLMRGVAGLSRRALQIRSLLSTTLALVHRKALFEYLRDRQVPGSARRRLIGHFYGHNDYVQTLLAEHGNYLRSTASFLCTAHIGGGHLQVTTFDEPLQAYVQLYTEYFRTYCDSVLAARDDEAAENLEALLPYLKQEVLETRNQLLKRPVKR
ncbi:MAG: hypothetical protein IT480_08230 [Gammaproteobacteria bacterium]|nr:hypothetical protein [Gammaproteobacteria bacterium]